MRWGAAHCSPPGMRTLQVPAIWTRGPTSPRACSPHIHTHNIMHAYVHKPTKNWPTANLFSNAQFVWALQSLGPHTSPSHEHTNQDGLSPLAQVESTLLQGGQAIQTSSLLFPPAARWESSGRVLLLAQFRRWSHGIRFPNYNAWEALINDILCVLVCVLFLCVISFLCRLIGYCCILIIYSSTNWTLNWTILFFADTMLHWKPWSSWKRFTSPGILFDLFTLFNLAGLGSYGGEREKNREDQ